MFKILHISSHYGGGVGTVVKAWKDNDKLNEHRLSFLNNKTKNYGELFDIEMINNSDIVVCHFWNHPALFDFLINTKLPACRFVFWGHISGLFAPYIYFDKLVEYSDKFVFTSPVSYKCKEIQELKSDLKEKLDVIWSTYGIEKFKNVNRLEHDEFVVGLTGTVDYGKLHTDFVDMCSKINIPNIKFVICSNDSYEHLKERAYFLNIHNKFLFKSCVENITDYLASYDVFGYPLQPTHFGSCEQALGEAMICGVVPVVLNNLAESHIIKHKQTGLIAKSIDEYCRCIEYLYNNKNELLRMSVNAKQEAEKKYNINNTINKWNELFSKIVKQEKREHIWSNYFIPPHIIYAISLGPFGLSFFNYTFSDLIANSELKKKSISEIRQLFKSNIMFCSDKKGSVKQYLNYFPNDKYLQEWEKLLIE